MKKLNQTLLTLILALALIGTAYAMVGSVQKTVDYTDIKITLNGTEIIPKDANGNPVEPFAIEGTTYLPVRAVANALGLEVGWDQETKTVLLTDNRANTAQGGSYETPTTTRNSGDVGDYYVTIHGADVLESDEGYPAIFFNFTWQNNTNETENFFVSSLSARAFQNGVQLDSVSTSDITSNYMRNLRPGATLTMDLAFWLNDVTSPVEFEVYDSDDWDNETLPATMVIEFDQ